MSEKEIFDQIQTILRSAFQLDGLQLEYVAGGYQCDETFVLHDGDEKMFLFKSIRLNRSKETIEKILQFTNLAIDQFHYPTARIRLTQDRDYLVEQHERLNYLQEFIVGVEPKEEYFVAHPDYFVRLGVHLSRWRSISRILSQQIEWTDRNEFSSSWWTSQHDRLDALTHSHRANLYQSFLRCQEELKDFDASHFELGFIHNDFHPNNSLINADGQIHVIDFIDGQYSFFVADLANSLFHLLIHGAEGIQRAKAFLHGYEQLNPLTPDERHHLQSFVRLKLTLSIAEDFQGTVDPFLHSCLDLLASLDEQPNFIQRNLLE